MARRGVTIRIDGDFDKLLKDMSLETGMSKTQLTRMINIQFRRGVLKTPSKKKGRPKKRVDIFDFEF